MREIKFRAWNATEQKMSKPFAWGADGDLFSKWMCTSPACELMQFTGLKDVNGVEIYELDIVKKTYKLHPDNKTFSVILIAELSCSTFTDDCGGGQDFYEDTIKLEVIGNIHQNPDLLEKAK